MKLGWLMSKLYGAAPAPFMAHGEACCLLHQHEIETALDAFRYTSLGAVKSVKALVELQKKLKGAMRDRWR